MSIRIMVVGDMLRIDRRTRTTSRSDNVNSEDSRLYEASVKFENHFVEYGRPYHTPQKKPEPSIWSGSWD